MGTIGSTHGVNVSNIPAKKALTAILVLLVSDPKTTLLKPIKTNKIVENFSISIPYKR
jgi:hypothetical protein